jgi:hypothetical protein
MLLLAVALFALAALLPGLAAPAQAQTTLPASLQGEGFFAYERYSSVFGDAAVGSAEVSSTCTPTAGETMTVSFSAEGIAYGPYPGEFTESGTAKATLLVPTLGAAAGTTIEWKSTFTIDSPAGKVTGTKTLRQSGFGALCYRDAVFPSQLGLWDAAQSDAYLHYEATIKPPTGGTFRDQGDAYAITNDVCISANAPCDLYEQDYFSENFLRSTGVLPVDTHGKATGGGQILSGSDPFERVTFGFNVRKDPNETRLKGSCNVLDHATGTHVKCLTVTDYQQIGNTATWEGTAEVNGDREHYRITVTDNGESNQGLDIFSIKTDSYEAAGNVQQGDVQLHKQAITL